MVTRLISHTEIEALLACQARHDFRYGDQLAGSALKPKGSRPILARGSAWGAGVYTLHATGSSTLANLAMLRSLARDARRQRKAGDYDRDAHREMARFLARLLDHYRETAKRVVGLERGEQRYEAPLGRGFAFEAFLDGLKPEDDGDWIVEFKLRAQLSSYEQVVNSRQPRRYAWAHREVTGREAIGVIVDERLAQLPEPDAEVAWTKAKNKSVPQRDGLVVGKRQACKPEAYVAACQSIGQDVDEDVVESLQRKHDPENYYRRHRIIFTPGELDEVGRELTTAVALVSLFDGHALYPIRAASPRVCASCDFRAICPDPSPGAIDADYQRVPPKRDRTPTLEAA